MIIEGKFVFFNSIYGQICKAIILTSMPTMQRKGAFINYMIREKTDGLNVVLNVPKWLKRGISTFTCAEERKKSGRGNIGQVIDDI